jgi:hypothetical protein
MHHRSPGETERWLAAVAPRVTETS